MLKNLRVQYDAAQDRLLLHLVTAGATTNEHLLHLTRRLWAKARLDLQAMLDISASAPPQMAATARQAISNAHHQALAAQARTEQRSSITSAPTQSVQLVADIQCGRRSSDGKWVLCFKLQNKAELTLILSDVTLHALVSAMVNQEARTGWGLVSLPAAAPLQAPGSSVGLH